MGRVRLARELFCNGYRPGQRVRLREVGAKHGLDNDAVLKIFREFQSLGLVTLSGNFSAVVHSPTSKEMEEAFEIRAALEEISGRTAAEALKGNTRELENELAGMHSAATAGDLDACAQHDVKFHKCILRASGNTMLQRVWDTLAFDVRIRVAIAKLVKDLPEVMESHQPIIDALKNGRGKEASVLLRNHVETVMEYLKRLDSDSGGMRSLRLPGCGSSHPAGTAFLGTFANPWARKGTHGWNHQCASITSMIVGKNAFRSRTATLRAGS